MLAACELPISETVVGPEEISPSQAQADESFLDWVPIPPFGTHVSTPYEFFPDSVESTFDSISTAYDTVTWRGRDYPRVIAYGDGWTVPVWSNPSVAHSLVADRIEKYMQKIGRLGRGILARSPEYGIALLDRVPNAPSSTLGTTVYRHDDDSGLVPMLVILAYDPFEGLLGSDHSEAGIVLHEFGHVIVDPVLNCTEKWRDAVIDDNHAFPSIYSRYGVKDYDPRIGTRQERSIEYWNCERYPILHAAVGDTIPSGEDIAESFAMWWLTRCKAGDEPALDRVAAAWFPNRLATLDRAMDPHARDPSYISTCQFPIEAASDADRLRLDGSLPSTIPDGITRHGDTP
ncbi:MAG: hypothetical protein OXI71_11545 [Gemmatimonadota bacterium]|nr:hypothetical protein [Gemmatimonadota bacterium]